VRAIAYSAHSQVLFSTADNGIVRKWDLHVGKSEDERKGGAGDKQMLNVRMNFLNNTSIESIKPYITETFRIQRYHPDFFVM
jgi:hypothetical protein